MAEYRTGLAPTTYNPRTDTYDTSDGTAVGAELIHGAKNIEDVFWIATIREQQRKAIREQQRKPANQGADK
jgi:hypothetical protein